MARDTKIDILANFLKLVEQSNIPLTTTRTNNHPLPYARVYEIDTHDQFTKTTDGGEVSIIFAVYSEHKGFLEILDMRETIKECCKKLYEIDERVMRANVDFSPVRDVQRPDVKQGFYTVNIKCAYPNK